MRRDLHQLTTGTHDLLVIGGGINGAAIANLAAVQGMRVALLEKDDFASGTSSKSTKLIHGGLRYLETLEFDLVKEALRERFIQLKSAPHLVRPLRLIIPVYKDSARPMWMLRLGVFLYDFLSGRCLIERHRQLSAQEVCQRIPGIKADGLVGGILYYDAQMDDARLVLENILSADAQGACAANYVEVNSFIKENGKVTGVRARDCLDVREFEVRSRQTVCAVGPWTQILLRLDKGTAPQKIRTTKGIHLVVNRKISDDALLIQIRRDQRIFFMIPWKGQTLIGTTDTDFHGSPDRVQAQAEDEEYLLTEANKYFPGHGFHREDIITTFAGLRPLAYQKGNPSRVSRRHVIFETSSGLWFLAGGKYTTYRAMAHECLERILEKKIHLTTEYPLFGSGPMTETLSQAAQESGLDEAVVKNLMAVYGSQYKRILKLTQMDATLKQKICACGPTIAAQVVYAIEEEMAQNPEDIIWRRLGLAYQPCASHECRNFIETRW